VARLTARLTACLVARLTRELTDDLTDGGVMGKLVSEMAASVVLLAVESETTVSGYLLVEDEKFLEQMKNAKTLEQLVDWVNENY
jgi:hypothetical protein